MRKVFESVINRGGYDLPAMLAKIDAYHVDGKLTDEDRDVLYAKARGGAEALVGVDIPAKLAEFERRIAALEAGTASGGGGASGAETYPEYTAGKWYYAGNKVTFGGKKYTCVAPDGVVCTWSPDEYPAYWETVGE